MKAVIGFWEEMSKDFNSGLWVSRLGLDMNITERYNQAAKEEDPKKADKLKECISKPNKGTLFYVDAPGWADRGVPAEGMLSAEQWTAVRVVATGTDGKSLTRKFRIHHKAKNVNDMWVADGDPEFKVGKLEQ